MFRILAVAAALLTSTAAAQLSDAQARKVLTDVNASTIAPVLRNAGMNPQTTTILGEDALVLKGGGMTTVLRPRVCNPNCVGLLVYTVVRGSAPADSLNAFNETTAPTSAYVHQGNTVLSRYLIADHGITAGTFLVNVAVFNSTVDKWLNNSRSAAALSVSLDGSMPSDIDSETEAFLAEIAKRPDLMTERPADAY
jgi:hypothetical protein